VHNACKLLHRASAQAPRSPTCKGGLEAVQRNAFTDEAASKSLLEGSTPVPPFIRVIILDQ
jgi:hypothetical protein